jgi:hypothetical protein
MTDHIGDATEMPAKRLVAVRRRPTPVQEQILDVMRDPGARIQQRRDELVLAGKDGGVFRPVAQRTFLQLLTCGWIVPATLNEWRIADANTKDRAEHASSD